MSRDCLNKSMDQDNLFYNKRTKEIKYDIFSQNKRPRNWKPIGQNWKPIGSMYGTNLYQLYGSYGKSVLHPEISQTFGGGLSLSRRCFFAVLTFLTCRRPLIRLRICLPLGTGKRAGTDTSNTANTACIRSIRLFLVIQSDLLRGSVISNQGIKRSSIESSGLATFGYFEGQRR